MLTYELIIHNNDISLLLISISLSIYHRYDITFTLITFIDNITITHCRNCKKNPHSSHVNYKRHFTLYERTKSSDHLIQLHTKLVYILLCRLINSWVKINLYSYYVTNRVPQESHMFTPNCILEKKANKKQELLAPPNRPVKRLT